MLYVYDNSDANEALRAAVQRKRGRVESRASQEYASTGPIRNHREHKAHSVHPYAQVINGPREEPPRSANNLHVPVGALPLWTEASSSDALSTKQARRTKNKAARKLRDDSSSITPPKFPGLLRFRLHRDPSMISKGALEMAGPSCAVPTMSTLAIHGVNTEPPEVDGVVEQNDDHFPRLTIEEQARLVLDIILPGWTKGGSQKSER